MPQENEILQAALGYAARGWHIFPCDPRNKHPVEDGGFHAATTDEQQIRAWWTSMPGAMIGCRTGEASGVWAIDLDIDPEKQLNGLATFASLAAGREPVPDTITSRTPRGGRHLLFRWTAPVKSRAGIAHGVDVRGDGGYLIMPPSQRCDGRHYEEIIAVWPPAEAPAWLAELVADKQPQKGEAHTSETPRRGNSHDASYGEAALKAECYKLAAAPPGTRNEVLNAAAFNLGQLVADGVLNEGEVRRRLEQAAYSCGLIRDDGKESVQATLDSGLGAGMKKPRGAPESERAKAKQSQGDRNEPGEQPLRWIDMANWDGEPRPTREWAILNRVPLRQAGLFSGEGGAGKSIIEMMKDVAHVAGKDWLGS